MNNTNCEKCLFGDTCMSEYDCWGYTPADDDEAIDTYINSGRQEFYEAWNSYLSEYAD